MTTYSKEYSAYPVEVTITELDGQYRKIPKARITYKDHMVGVYDVRVDAPFVFKRVLWSEATELLQRLGAEALVVLDDGRVVHASAPRGCGCGDPGKKYPWPEDTGGIVDRLV